MSTTSKQVLRMSFVASDGSTKTLSVLDPRADITGAEVEAVMDSIISSNIFHTTGGSLATKKSADLVETVTTEMYESMN